jgi:predicted membrane protein
MVVVLGTAVATAFMYSLLRTKLARWWSFALAGALTGLFPALFYLVATPSADMDWVPIGPMMTSGLTAGLFTGLVSYFVTKREEVASEA